eukprot:SAG11_NODE_233_length_11903_cov_4.983650_7_plen_1348_part_00
MVKVTLRDDHVYEPQVFGRGQDAYVHHYVVAEDVNLQHTYYEDIDVNDLVVSVTDNDPALVLQQVDAVTGTQNNIPTEGEDFHNSDTPDILLRLASEPLYDVTVYLQSGPFFSSDAPSAALDFMPDDEQVIFQDKGQYDVCFDTETGLRSVDGDHANLCTTDAHLMRTEGLPYDTAGDRRVFPFASFAPDDGDSTNLAGLREADDSPVQVHACDPNGFYVRPESYKDTQDGSVDLSYHLPTGWICTGLNTEDECEADAAIAAGCEWEVQEYVWEACSCVGTLAEGEIDLGTDWPHGDRFPHDGTKYEKCLDTQLTTQLTTLGVIDSDGNFDQTVQAGTPMHIFQTFCENMGTLFDDDDGTITGVRLGGAQPGACLEGCPSWDGANCWDASGALVPNLKSLDACTKTGNRFIADAAEGTDGLGQLQATSCIRISDGMYITDAETEADCTGATGNHWTAEPQCVDPSGNVVADLVDTTDYPTACTDYSDGCECTFGPAVWAGVHCTYRLNGGLWQEVTATTNPLRVDPSTEEGCEGFPTGRVWDGAACDTVGDDGHTFTTETACTGLSSYTDPDGVSGLHEFSWHGTSYDTNDGNAGNDGAATQLGYCEEPIGYDSAGNAMQGGVAVPGPAGEVVITAADCAAADSNDVSNVGGKFANGNQYFAGAGVCRIVDDDLGKEVAVSCDPLAGTSQAVCDPDGAATVGGFAAGPATPCEEACMGCTMDQGDSNDAETENQWIDTIGFCRAADGSTDETLSSKTECEDNYDESRSQSRGSCINSYTHSKSMDMACGTNAESDCPNQEGCVWSATASSCVSEDLGHDCNSFVVFTSTNWNTWQTLKVIAVQDDEDETEDKPEGTDTSEVGYLYTSRDWYYNSPGSSLLSSTNAAYTPSAESWSETIENNDGDTSVSVDSQPALSGLSMFDTRFGTHINRYPWTLGDADIPSDVVDCADLTDVAAQVVAGQDHSRTEDGTSGWAASFADSAFPAAHTLIRDNSGHVIEPVGFLDEPHINCALQAPHALDAMNKVCLDMDADADATIDGPLEQVTTFDPTEFAIQEPASSCGAASQVVDTNVRKVYISRSSCDATEGRRFYYKDFNHQVNPTEFEWKGHVGFGRGQEGHIRGLQRTEAPQKLPTTLGLFFEGDGTQDGSIEAAIVDAADSAAATDLWTTSNALASEVAEYEIAADKKMSMPTCPFTITLETAPQEGTTVVVKVFEDPLVAKHRDNELYFYEEPTFRAGVGKTCVEGDGITPTAACDECDIHFPGSTWIAHDGGSCFIQNVDYDGGATLKFHPRGGKAIDVMFTDQVCVNWYMCRYRPIFMVLLVCKHWYGLCINLYIYLVLLTFLKR